MSYNNPRIGREDTGQDVLFKMCEGNPGALNVLMQIVKEAERIDPDSALGWYGPVMDLDTLDIYGSHIWVLYKDVCGQSVSRLLGLLRAYQLGFVEGDLITAAAVKMAKPAFDLSDLLEKVKQRLPAFQL